MPRAVRERHEDTTPREGVHRPPSPVRRGGLRGGGKPGPDRHVQRGGVRWLVVLPLTQYKQCSGSGIMCVHFLCTGLKCFLPTSEAR